MLVPLKAVLERNCANACGMVRDDSARFCSKVPLKLLYSGGWHRIAGTKKEAAMPTPKRPLITTSSDVLGGTPVFAGTRVPVQTLIEYLEGGETIDDFLEGFPTVTREQVIAFLEEAKSRMLPVAS